jgi:hypothetical protein
VFGSCVHISTSLNVDNIFYFLFCGDPYEEVMRKLVQGLAFTATWRRDWHVPTASALARARERLPMLILPALIFPATLAATAPTKLAATASHPPGKYVDGIGDGRHQDAGSYRDLHCLV